MNFVGKMAVVGNVNCIQEINIIHEINYLNCLEQLTKFASATDSLVLKTNCGAKILARDRKN